MQKYLYDKDITINWTFTMKREEKRMGETQVKQDSRIRIVVLATKLGIKAPHIAKILKQTNRRRSQK